MKNLFAIIGGDQRQRHLAQLLRADGHTVLTALLGGADDVPLEAATGADCVILPLPVSRDGVSLHTPLWEGSVPLTALYPLLPGGAQVLCGGNVDTVLRETFAMQGLTLLDYYDREEVQIANAVPTAEGAIAAAMSAMDRTLHRMDCLVVGYGRIGKVLAHRLTGLGSRVTVSARRLTDLAWIDACGYAALRTGALSGHLGGFDLIFNTVPVPLLCRDLLAELRPDCLIVDLASAPGGVDLPAAESLSLRVIQVRGLPGKTAPATAAAAVRGAVYHILEERGEPI